MELIIITGPRFSGKSTLAHRIATKLYPGSIVWDQHRYGMGPLDSDITRARFRTVNSDHDCERYVPELVGLSHDKVVVLCTDRDGISYRHIFERDRRLRLEQVTVMYQMLSRVRYGMSQLSGAGNRS